MVALRAVVPTAEGMEVMIGPAGQGLIELESDVGLAWKGHAFEVGVVDMEPETAERGVKDWMSVEGAYNTSVAEACFGEE